MPIINFKISDTLKQIMNLKETRKKYVIQERRLSGCNEINKKRRLSKNEISALIAKNIDRQKIELRKWVILFPSINMYIDHLSTKVLARINEKSTIREKIINA